ncbi:MAG: Hsp20/alpha crystallin family protein [Haloglomus sp.]
MDSRRRWVELMHENPFERIERMLEAAGTDFPHTRMLGEEHATTAVDVAEQDGEFVVTCDLPGFEKDDIDLRVTDHTLHLHAEHTTEEAVEEEDYLHRERKRTDVSRSISLPEDVDEAAVSATHEDGVLTVRLPKAREEADEAHEVPIS